MKWMTMGIVALSVAGANDAFAAQFTISPDILGPNGYVASYKGAGAERSMIGAVSDGGRDAFDGYGSYTVLGGLSLMRQTEAFTNQNLFRFFDTFTNNGTETVTRTVTFFGNLGSDSRTAMQARGPGYLTTCQMSGSACGGDPIVSAVYGNNGLGIQSLAGENYNVNYTLTLAPGQSLSILNFAFLASSLSGTTQSDMPLAAERAFDLVHNPYLDGLSQKQLHQIANFDLKLAGGVPEPATWAMMILGFGAIAMRMRAKPRRASIVVAAA